ncbi:MAG TPA: maleylpyruvate isomerase N-terminal domain-containing protein [Acidimicrobiales bacterium]|nr:maleylpyruvate isomerase N-terminal domain-containing protein [Acidimicrobiales bacterium]
MNSVDLEAPTRQLADLIRKVPDVSLDAPTPCPAYRVGDLIEHIGGLALAFTAAAAKTGGEALSRAPSGDASRLAPDWRTRIPGTWPALLPRGAIRQRGPA